MSFSVLIFIQIGSFFRVLRCSDTIILLLSLMFSSPGSTPLWCTTLPAFGGQTSKTWIQPWRESTGFQALSTSYSILSDLLLPTILSCLVHHWSLQKTSSKTHCDEEVPGIYAESLFSKLYIPRLNPKSRKEYLETSWINHWQAWRHCRSWLWRSSNYLFA